VITSGLATGIDGAAHEGALEAGGKTIAVIGTGIDRVYPARHRLLNESIVQQGGLILSEFPLGVSPQPSHFPRRNRIISGLSLGVLVVEASLRSGSLITAHQAIDAGREVYAIPGSIHNPMSKGCHQLLRQGAKLVESVEDILEELDGLFAFHYASKANIAMPVDHKVDLSCHKTEVPNSTQYPEVLNAMGFDVISLDSLVERTQESVVTLSQKIMMMEIEGVLRSVPGGYQRITN
jgi:DNA processing protein